MFQTVLTLLNISVMVQWRQPRWYALRRGYSHRQHRLHLFERRGGRLERPQLPRRQRLQLQLELAILLILKMLHILMQQSLAL